MDAERGSEAHRPAGGQDVRGAGEVVAGGHRGALAEQRGPDRAHPGEDRLGVTGVDGDVLGRDRVGHGGEAIVNPTNGSSYTGTILQTQQVASSRLRAVENGRWVVQAAPTGFSAFVTDDGHVLERTAVSEARVITHEVPLRHGSTWYRVLGDWPFRALLAGVLGLSWWGARRRASALTPPAAP